jgi:hypothetical protein
MNGFDGPIMAQLVANNDALRARVAKLKALLEAERADEKKCEATDFSRDDYIDLATRLRSLANVDEPSLRAVLSNNLNVILGALNDAADGRQDRCSARVAKLEAALRRCRQGWHNLEELYGVDPDAAIAEIDAVLKDAPQ